MAETHETIADIRKDAEAKFRELVESYMQRRAAFQTTVGAMQAFNTVFDRLEAAWKRDTKELRVEIERLKEERNYSGVRERERLRAKGFAIVPKEQLKRGDASKLREALEDVLEKIDRWRTDGSMEHWQYSQLFDLADDALAEPPRNCDKYPTFNDAIRALADKRGWHDGKWNSERYCILAQWLLAPATEKEGGDDGK